MRITIEIPDDQVPPSYRCNLHQSGYAEDNLHDLIMNDSILRKMQARLDVVISEEISEGFKNALIASNDCDIKFLKLLKQNMKIGKSCV